MAEENEKGASINQQITLAELLGSKFLQCSNCDKRFEDPVLLPCLHSFCQICINELSTTNSEQLQCSVCQSQIAVTNNRHKPSNKFLSNLCKAAELKDPATRQCEYCKFDGKHIKATTFCLECNDDMCGPCSRAHQRTRVTREHKVAPYDQVMKGLYDHDIRLRQQINCDSHTHLKLSLICAECVTLICTECQTEEHGGHVVSSLEASYPQYEEELSASLQALKTRIPAIGDYIMSLESHVDTVQATEQRLIADMNQQAKKLHQMVDQHERTLVSKLKQACKEEVDNIENKCKDLTTTVRSLKENTDFLDHLLKFGKPAEILSIHGLVIERLKQLSHMKLDEWTDKLVMDFVLGSPTKQNIEIIFGRVNVTHCPVDEDILLSRMMIANVLPPITDTPSLVGTFDTKLESDSVSVWPSGLCISDANIVIVDRDNKKIKTFTKDGNFKSEFTGSGESRLGSPYDATLLIDGRIAVTDYKDENVKIFHMDGQISLTIKDHFRHPRGITTNKQGHLIVVDCHLHQVMTFDDQKGKLISSFKSRDTKGEQLLTDPTHITTTENGDLIVTDQAAPNVKIFNKAGLLLAQYGTYGTHKDQVLHPYGVCVDRFGYIFVADHQNHRVHMLLPDGRFYRFILTPENKLWHPVSLAINNHGQLVVAEALGKVKIFKYT